MTTVEDLHASASRLTGLSDFGPDDYTDGLAVLLESYERDAALTPAGAKAARSMIRGALMARLLSEAGWQAYPECASVPVRRPVFVTGLPRTGTTALHRLLVADPAHQGLELWLAEAPRPRPPRADWAGDPVFQYIAAACARHHVAHPEFMEVHYVAADQVEECWQLLRQSMRSVSFECLAHLPGYSAWLRAADWTAAYRRHRRNLQLIGLNDPGRRWVLKNPSHLFALDALLAVYPDALVIQTHRDPRAAIASVCSLAAQASDGWSESFRGPVIGRDQLELWASGLEDFWPNEPGSTRPNSVTCGTRTSWPTRSAPWRRCTGTSGCRCPGRRRTRCARCPRRQPHRPAPRRQPHRPAERRLAGRGIGTRWPTTG